MDEKLLSELIDVLEEAAADERPTAQVCALVQAYATIRAAQLTSEATVEASRLSKEGMARAAYIGATTDKREASFCR